MSIETSAAVLFGAIIKLFLLSTAGYAAVRFRLISDYGTEILSRFIIHVSLPCLIIATLGENLKCDMVGELAVCALAALTLNILSIALAFVFQKLFIPHNMQGRRLFISLSSMQNSGYLPIPLVMAVLPAQLKPEGLLFTFVFIMVMGSLFWSLGVWLIAEGAASDWRSTIKKIANPPMAALLLGLLFLAPPIKQGYTSLYLLPGALTLIGNLTIPFVMITLGASFGKGVQTYEGVRRVIGISSLVKLAVIPVLTLLAVKALDIEGVFAFTLVLQASMPAAMNHIIVVRGYGGNIPLTTRALFVQYLLSIITVPLFLYLFELL
jgi:predicted permease